MCVQHLYKSGTIPRTGGEEADLGERASDYSAKRPVVLPWQPCIHHTVKT